MTSLMGIIGHEIGHVMKRHSKNAFRQSLLTGALKDAAGAANNTVAALTDSQARCARRVAYRCQVLSETGA